MAALVVGDRAQETCTTTGTGTLSLLGAVTQFQSFAAVGISTGNTTSYSTQFTIADQSGANWETSIGVYTTSGSTLTRTTVVSSSNGGALVNFGAGTKFVFMDYSATMAVSGGGGGTYPTIQPSLNLDFANSKQLDPRITFVRNSTATYYDGQTTALAEQNLLVQSENLLTSWTTVNTTVTGGQTDPLGTTTAFKLVAISGVNEGAYNTGGGVFVSGTTYSISGWFKADSAVSLYIGSTAGSAGVTFSLTTVWTYFSASVTATAAGSLWIKPTSSVPIYVWHPQLEQRSSVTAYTPTTTSAITNYIPQLMTAAVNVARFDCDPITRNSLGLLIEESRTNLLTYSSDFSDAVWTKTNSTITTAANVAPDGTLTASKMISNPSNNYHYGSRVIAVSTSTTYTYSIYAKAGEYNTGFINFPNDSALSTFNLATGTVMSSASGVSTSIQSVGNGWYRLICTYTTGAAETTTGAWFGLKTSSFLGDGYSGIYIWGAQLEAGSFATSYIPTVASTVTRALDATSMTGINFSSWYNQSEWSFYWESNSAVSTVNAVTWEMFNGVNIPGTGWNNTNGGQVRFITSGSSTVNQITGTIVSGSTNKYSATTKPGTGNNILALNGSVIATTASPAWMYIPTGIYFYDVNSGGNFSTLNGHIKKLSYYPKSLSSSNLVALTS